MWNYYLGAKRFSGGRALLFDAILLFKICKNSRFKKRGSSYVVLIALS